MDFGIHGEEEKKVNERPHLTLDELTVLQSQFDAAHSWALGHLPKELLVGKLKNEIIGLCGECGELANIVKKVITYSQEEEQAENLASRRREISQECADILIYLLRITTLLDINLEESYIEKLKFNEERFRGFRTNDPT